MQREDDRRIYKAIQLTFQLSNATFYEPLPVDLEGQGSNQVSFEYH